jgi:hypothetical protein
MSVADSGGTVLGVFLVAVLVGGYVVLWALWYFVFRGAREDDDRTRDPDDP